jgi:phosphatidate cytidylyltransferase
MLRLRITTALLLLAVLVPAIFYPRPLVFSVVTGILLACGAWEWLRLNSASQAQALTAGVFCGAICAALWVFPPSNDTVVLVWGITGLLWVCGGCYLLRHGGAAWSAIPRGVRWILGIGLLVVAWLAVVKARMIGINFLFSAMALVWVADIGAYFAGRKFGSRFFSEKLAPTISPGKTKEGAIGGLLGVVCLSVLWCFADRNFAVDSKSLFTHLLEKRELWLLGGAVFLGLTSIAGDLLESLVKRVAGAKDSSQLLPGHGGVLDRVDALLPVLPLAMFLQAL